MVMYPKTKFLYHKIYDPATLVRMLCSFRMVCVLEAVPSVLERFTIENTFFL